MSEAEFEARPGMTDEVLYARDGHLGRILLNRPRVINVLNHDMVASIMAALKNWEHDNAVAAVSVQGAGERGLCAGGDVRALRKVVMAGSGEAVRFWAHEYQMNAAIGAYPKPFVAFMDGVVMGGGVGISAHGSLRLVTERSRVAMPETTIGFSPDVGSLFLLSRAPGEIGTHLAMTGLSIGGADAITCGLADALIASEDIPGIIARLAAGESLDPGVGRIPAAGDLAAAREWIDPCYAGDDALTILRTLRAHSAVGAQHAADVLETRAPLAVSIALKAIRRASRMHTLTQVLEQDLMLGGALADSVDFVEGVRALLVDRDNAPRWQHRSLADVDPAEVARVFAGDLALGERLA
ncbi:MAG: 3-hydroxyisobutyryl-CoA hydrolase [Actinomycetota bacterium]